MLINRCDQRLVLETPNNNGSHLRHVWFTIGVTFMRMKIPIVLLSSQKAAEVDQKTAGPGGNNGAINNPNGRLRWLNAFRL